MSGRAFNILVSEMEDIRANLKKARENRDKAADQHAQTERTLSMCREEQKQILEGLRLLDPTMTELLEQSDWAEEP